MKGFLHHLDLTVSDVRRAFPIYDAFLRSAGFVLKGRAEDWAGWGLDGRRYPCVTILQARGSNAEREHDRYSPGLHHFALAANSRADIDSLYDALKSIGAAILDAPALYASYGPEYYALFFADPDGLKLEYVFTPEPQQTIAEMRAAKSASS